MKTFLLARKITSEKASSGGRESSKTTRNLAFTSKTIETVLAGIKKTLSTQKSNPLAKLIAVKMAKDCMEIFNDNFVEQAQKSILPEMDKIALFEMENKDINKGSHLFTNQNDKDENLKKIGISLYSLVLECIFVWSKWFPINPDTKSFSDYRLVYERLVIFNIQFP